MNDILEDLRKQVKWRLERQAYELSRLRSEILSKLPQGPGITGRDPLFEVQKKIAEIGLEVSKLSDQVKVGFPKPPIVRR